MKNNLKSRTAEVGGIKCYTTKIHIPQRILSSYFRSVFIQIYIIKSLKVCIFESNYVQC